MFKRDIIITIGSIWKRIVLVIALLFFSFIIYAKYCDNVVDFLNILVPKNNIDVIYENFYFLTLFFSGYFITVNTVSNDLFRNNWMFFIRCKKKSNIFISKMFFLFLFDLIFYQVIGIFYDICSYYLFRDISIIKSIHFFMLVIGCGVYSISILTIFLEMFFKETISILISIIVVLANLLAKNIFLIGGIISILMTKSYDLISFIPFFLNIIIVIFVSTILYVKKDRY